jgi:hypothetical protein
MFYFLGDRFDTKHPFLIEKQGRWTIFLGVPAIGFAVLLCKAKTIEDFLNVNVSVKFFPYAFFGAMAALVVAGMILYNFVPKHWVLPLGIAGWVTTFSLLLWYFVFTDPLQHFH